MSIYKFSLVLIIVSISSITQANTLNPGDLYISEVMANPSAVSDTNGEWFEIFNVSANAINLNGLSISDDNSNMHIIDGNEPLFIAPGEYFVLGRNNDVSINGGYNADYVYTNFSLSNSSDQIVLSFNDIEISRIDYSGLPFGVAGVSAELISQSFPLASGNYQQTLLSQYGAGDFGTPGEKGSFNLSSAAPVPLPGAFWLFSSALLWCGRKAIRMS